MLSVSTSRFYKNPHHYTHLRKKENLYWSTPQGWMLIMEYPQPAQDDHTSSTAAYLWNPRTGDKLPLPNIPEHHDVALVSRCLLTHKDPAAHPGCVVVLLLLKDGAVPHMWFCHTAGDGRRWRCFPYEIPDDLGLPIKKFITVITACQGKLYFIDCSGSMGAIHFPSGDRPVFQYFDVPEINDLPNGTTSGSYWLVDSPDDNNLFLIYECNVWNSRSKSNLLVAVHAYKMDFSTHAWHRVRDIGDAVVFLGGGHSAASCAASPHLGLKRNHIYFVDYRKSSDDSASYYLCTFDLGLDILEDIWIVPHQSLLHGRTPFWIVPPTY